MMDMDLPALRSDLARPTGRGSPIKPKGFYLRGRPQALHGCAPERTFFDAAVVDRFGLLSRFA